MADVGPGPRRPIERVCRRVPAGSLRRPLGGRAPQSVRSRDPLGTIRLRNRGLGTSGSAFQNFVVDGRVYGHILDPEDRRAGGGPASVTVLAPTAAEADALSTAFYLLGTESAANYLGVIPRSARSSSMRIIQGLPPSGRSA